jgi:hypothetical protein
VPVRKVESTVSDGRSLKPGSIPPSAPEANFISEMLQADPSDWLRLSTAPASKTGSATLSWPPKQSSPKQ